MKLSSNAIVERQKHVERVRNVCVIAHVDHGKTSLTDSLLASNRIISDRLAGKVRYLDSREDEQSRGITMESHLVSLLYTKEENEGGTYLINLIDSPGHVDFSSDVSAATRLSDGALLVVDVVEGVQVQTHAVMRTAFEEGIKMVLVLNKLDRLITEVCLTIQEAAAHLDRVIESVNSIISGFLREESSGVSEKDFEEIERRHFFSPDLGNVIFASATDSWGFVVSDFVPLIMRVFELPESQAGEIKRGLWGQYYFDAKQKRVMPIGADDEEHPEARLTMFADLILRNLWEVYNVVRADPPKPKRFENVLRVLNVNPPREAKSKEWRTVIRAVMGAWLPLAGTLLDAIVARVPGPQTSQITRGPKLLPPSRLPERDEEEVADEFARGVETCDSTAPCIVFVSKMVSVPIRNLHPKVREFCRAAGEIEEEEAFVAVARVFSGTVNTDVPLRLSTASLAIQMGMIAMENGGAHHHEGESANNPPPSSSRVLPLLTMSTEYFPIGGPVPAGNVLALAGLGRHVVKTGTLVEATPRGDRFPPRELRRMAFQSAPIFRVSIEPNDPRDWAALSRGLKTLNRTDPAIEVRVQPSGEHVVCAIGELHLERCLKDLRDRFARVEFRVSAPMASFRETLALTLTPSSSSDPVSSGGDASSFHLLVDVPPFASLTNASTSSARGSHGYVTSLTTLAPSSAKLRCVARAVPLPERLVRRIEAETKDEEKRRGAMKDNDDDGEITKGKEEEEEEENDPWHDILLLSGTGRRRLAGPTKTHRVFLRLLARDASNGCALLQVVRGVDLKGEVESQELPHILRDAAVSGFHLAVRAGPLCEEPVRGVAYLLESAEVIEGMGGENLKKEDLRDVSEGQLVSALADSFRKCLRIYSEFEEENHHHDSNSPMIGLRLCEAMFHCSLHCLAEGDQLGKLYRVVAKRRGKVISDVVIDGTNLYQLEALIPVVEAFGLAEELRQKTSGAASSPQLTFSHWEVVPIDPFARAGEEEEDGREERLEGGAGGGGGGGGESGEERLNNLAYRLVVGVRRRKGLSVPTDKLVRGAEKQRTLSRKR